MVITLPWPPSLNGNVRHSRYGSYKTPAYKAFTADAVAAIWEQHGMPAKPLARCRVAIELTPPDKRRRDADNHVKPILDALVEAKLLADDNSEWVKEVRVEWSDRTVRDGECVVYLEPVGETK